MHYLILTIMLIFQHSFLYSETLINMPGNYVFGQDLTGDELPVHITVDDVIVNLEYNRLVSGSNGIVVDADLTNIRLINGVITLLTGTGIFIGEGCTDIQINNMNISLCDYYAIQCSGTDTNPINQLIIDNCNTVSCSQAISGSVGAAVYLTHCNESSITNCMVSDNSNNNVSVFKPLLGENLTSCVFQNVTSRNNQSILGIGGFTLVNGSNNTIENCSALNNTVTSTTDSFAYGFWLSGSTLNQYTLNACIAQDNQGGLSTAGFILDGAQVNILLTDCQSLQNTATNESYGFSLVGSASFINFIDCQAQGNSTTNVTSSTAIGYHLVSASHCKLLRCYALDQSGQVAVGIDLNIGMNCSFEGCQAYNNLGATNATSFGIRINDGQSVDAGNNIFIRNIAANNGATAGNQMNNFIAGSFTNIAYSSLNTVTQPFINLGVVP